MTEPHRSDTAGSFSPGWFPDPLGRFEHRWFNGMSWTSDVSTDGQRFVDPLGATPGGPGGPYSATGTPAGNGPATAAMTCGIVGTMLACLPFLVVGGFALAVLAIVFGVKGRRRAKQNGHGAKMAMAGIITGVIGLGLCVVGVITTSLTWTEVLRYAEPGRASIVVDDCVIDGRSALVTGTVTNESDKFRSYTVFVTVSGVREWVTVDDVAPDATTTWSARVTDDVIISSCEPEIVLNGPFPFGIEMDPVEP